MAQWVNQARDVEGFQIRNLATDDENDRFCRGFLEDLRFNQLVRIAHLDSSPYFGSVEGCRMLGDVVRSNTTLQELSLSGVGMNGDGLEYIILGLMSNRNSALVKLDISRNGLGEKGAKLVEELLLANIPTLERLGIFETEFTQESTAPLARALAKNTTLHELACGGGFVTDRDGPLSSILRALTPVEQASNQEGKYNETLQSLTMFYEFDTGLAGNLVRMLSRNSSLQSVTLCNFELNSEEWGEVWSAAKNNKRVQVGLYNCGNGLGDAFGDFVDVRMANWPTRDICMGKTQSETAGQSVPVKLQLDPNAGPAEFQLGKSLTYIHPGNLLPVHLNSFSVIQ